MPLQAVSSRKLYIQIAEQITELIDNGEFANGWQLPSERDLAAELGVSRPTVREALIALEVAGLVEVKVGVGAFVRQRPNARLKLPIADHSPFEVMQARIVIEPEVAALAAENGSSEEGAWLEAILNEMRAQTRRGEYSASTDRALHEGIAALCNNQTLREFVLALWREREEKVNTHFHDHLGSLASIREHILGDHESIVTAIRLRDIAGARQAMRAHLDYVQREMQANWE